MLDFLGFAYAAAVASGGLIGYMKAGSVVSLCMGLGFGGVSAFGAYQVSQNPHNYGVLLGTSATLGAFMGYRAFNSGKFMPAGLICALSLLTVARFIPRLMSKPHDS